MDQDLRNMIEENNTLLKETVKLSRENNKKIRKIHGTIKRGFFAKIIYWLIIIALTAGAFYAVKPYADRLIEQYHTLTGQVNEANEFIQNPASSIFQKSFNPSGIGNIDASNFEFIGDLIQKKEDSTQ